MYIFYLVIKILSIIFLLLTLFIPCVIISIVIILDSKGPVLHWSKRVGINNKIFLMPKFRTMNMKTKNVASHLLETPEKHVTRFGKILRKTSLDEIPQIYSILKKDMNFIGPRPALYNQLDLIKLRTQKNIHKIYPGITGLAQVNGRDNLTINDKVYFDSEYYRKNNIGVNIQILIKTFKLIILRSNIKH